MQQHSCTATSVKLHQRSARQMHDSERQLYTRRPKAGPPDGHGSLGGHACCAIKSSRRESISSDRPPTRGAAAGRSRSRAASPRSSAGPAAARDGNSGNTLDTRRRVCDVTRKSGGLQADGSSLRMACSTRGRAAQLKPNFEQQGPVLVLTHNDHQRDGGSWVLRKSPARGDLGSAAQH